eukprot:TRINITY_DN34597_c0_g1_i1.p1 TRINITY_DN34597_c0_g1~~TRINITY_DN34597_c0_g1_i1.p1  ORF type:complete len:442 (+),score=47.34 TRINITY_DN34597_c0_g1_i1:40-1365(+)
MEIDGSDADGKWVQGYARPPGSRTSSTLALSAKKPNAARSSLLLVTITSLTKNIIGNSIIALPSALCRGGMGFSIIVFVAMAGMSLIGFLVIGHVCRISGAKSYREAWIATVGSHVWLVDFMITLECVGSVTGYIIVIIDYLSVGLHGLVGLPITQFFRAGIASTTAAVVLIPLCLKQNMHALRLATRFGICALGYTILYVIFTSATDGRHAMHLESASFWGADTGGSIRVLCTLTSAYMSHYNAPAFHHDLLSHPSPWKAFSTAATVSFTGALLTYLSFAIAGYAHFGTEVKGNVLMGFRTSLGVQVAWISMALQLMMTYPLILKSARDTLVQLLGFAPPSAASAGTLWVSPWSVASASLVIFTVVVGTVVTDISKVLAFRGALLGINVCFVLPGVMLLFCVRKESKQGHWRLQEVFLAWMLILFGLSSSMIGVYCAIQF